VKRDVGRQHNIGFVATTYNFTDQHNHTAGFDGRFRLDEKTTTEFQVVGTNSRRNFFDPVEDRVGYRTGNGFGYSYTIDRSDRNWFLSLAGNGRTRDFITDVGFRQRTDTNFHSGFVQYQTERDAKKAIIFKRIFNQAQIAHDWAGRTQTLRNVTEGMLALQRQTYVGAGVEFGYERVLEREFGAIRTAARPNQGAFFGENSERSAPRKEIFGFVETTPMKQLFFFGELQRRKSGL
jgi:hypothetical protein